MRRLVELDDVSGVFVDCCIEHDRRLVFMSFLGRDTALQELMARLTLSTKDGGIDILHLNMDSHTFEIDCFDRDRYLKKTGRITSRNFGQLSQMWLYDERCITADRANLKSYVLLQNHNSNDAVIWERVKDLCPYPLLDHWQEAILKLLRAQQNIEGLHAVIGDISAAHLSFSNEELAHDLGTYIKNGVLALR